MVQKVSLIKQNDGKDFAHVSKSAHLCGTEHRVVLTEEHSCGHMPLVAPITFVILTICNLRV